MRECVNVEKHIQKIIKKENLKLGHKAKVRKQINE